MKFFLLAASLLFASFGFAKDETEEPMDSISPWVCAQEVDGNAEKIAEQIQKRLTHDDIDGAIAFASTCATWGSSMDVSLIAPVANAIAKDISSKLTKNQKAVMNELLAKCQKKGDDDGGTLGQSGAAHCKLNVYHGFYSAVKTWN